MGQEDAQFSLDTRPSDGDRSGGLFIGTSTSASLLPVVIDGANATILTSSVVLIQYLWNHIALTRTSGTLMIWVNGAAGGSVTDGSNLLQERVHISGFSSITNVRMVKGTAVYTQAFTPPTESLTAIEGTQLLLLYGTGEDLNDRSPNKFTVNGYVPYVNWSSASPVTTLRTLPTMAVTLSATLASVADQSDVTCALWWRDDNTIAKIPGVEVVLHYMHHIFSGETLC